MNAGIFAKLCGLSLGLIFGLISRDKGNLTYWFLVGGLLGGHVGGLIAGFACIQHFTLRFILWRNGSIPWNYARFLNYATDRMFLQRVGGRYRFIHDLLREHFAQMPLD